MADFDTIVIGSGAGGMTAAVALANTGRKVLVLEQHYLPGGWCHSFPLGGYHFSPGVHYVGELDPGGRLRRIYEGLGVSGDLVFCELNPDGYDHVLIGDPGSRGGLRRFDYPKGRPALQARLSSAYPHEAKGIARYLDTMQRISDDLGQLMKVKGPLDALAIPLRSPSLARWGLRSLDRLLDARFDDPYVKAIAAIQCGDNGLPPSKIPVALHAAVMGHYFDGGWYPMGGARSIPRAFIRALKRAGGKIRVDTAVERILVENGHAIGVRLATGEEIRADEIVSNADPEVTYRQLVGTEHLPDKLVRRLDRTRWSVGCVSLFMAADIDAHDLGLDSGNYWYLARPDLESAYPDSEAWTDLDRMDELPALFLTVTSLKDRTKFKGGGGGEGRGHTMEAFALVPFGPYERWKRTEHGARPADYERHKAHVAELITRALERIVPGIRDALVFGEVGTPITNVHYVSATGGNMYGIEKNLRQVGPFAYPVRSPLQGLTLCGASTTGHGVMGATLSGVVAASAVSGVRSKELLSHQGPSLRVVPADRPEQWPDDLQRKLQA